MGGHQCLSQTLPLRLAVERWCEQGLPLCMLQVDLGDAVGTVRFSTAWKALKYSLGARRALLLFRLLLNVTTCVIWCGVKDPSRIHIRTGGHQGSCEIPLPWEPVMGFVLGPAVAKWQRQGKGLRVERCALVSLVESPPVVSRPLHAAKCADRLASTMLTGHFVLVSEGLVELRCIARDLVSSTSAESLRIPTGKLHVWCCVRPARIRVAGIYSTQTMILGSWG